MKKLKPFLPSTFAVLSAVFVSIVLIEDTIILLACLAVALVTPAIASIRCIHPKRSRWRAFGLTITPAILFILIAWSHIPLRLVFWFHRSQFEQVVSEFEAGNPPATPFRIGPFKIKVAGRRGESGTPYLATNEESSEIEGFVRHPDGQGFNLWSCITLDDEWSYIAED